MRLSATLYSGTGLKQSSNRQNRPAELLQKAVDLHRSGDQAAAVRIYRKILKSEPGHPDALNFMGIAAHQSGRLDDAIELIRRSVTSQPRNPSALKNLGNLLVEKGEYQEAVRVYLDAKGISPDDASLHANLSVAYRHLGSPVQAINPHARQPSQPDLLISSYNLANASRRRSVQKALAASRRSLQIDPHSPPLTTTFAARR